MFASSASVKKVTQRKRRVHQKSRLGCRNCKLRGVKCDETWPKCSKCLSFRLLCNYDAKTPDLQVSIDTVAEIGVPKKPICSINQSILGMISMSLGLCSTGLPEGNDVYQLRAADLERLSRFQTRTVLTIGTAKGARIYRNEIVKLAYLHPYLMHLVMNITAMHDRLLSPSPNAKQTVIEIYHSSQAAALFNKKLSMPIQPSDRDALWATAILLGIMALSSTEASSPEESWPLHPSSPSDLEWLRLSDGKKAIWTLADPLRSDSVFHGLADEHENNYSCYTSPVPGIGVTLSPFDELCGLDDKSTADNNPYHTAVHTLAPLLRIDCNISTILNFLTFIMNMHPNFKSLLEKKDSRSLLILAYWFAKVCHYQWWISRRAMLECRATCIYLRKYHAPETAIQRLLLFPKTRCGLATQQDDGAVQ